MTSENLTIIGIDPGLSGAIALLNGEKVKNIWDMPVESKMSGGRRIDTVGLIGLQRSIKVTCDMIGRPLVIVLEATSAMPGQGVSSMFSMGEALGCARMFASLFGAPLYMYGPSHWKRKMGVPPKSPKDYSITLAKRLCPSSSGWLTLKKHDGRAEAVLLALAHSVISK